MLGLELGIMINPKKDFSRQSDGNEHKSANTYIRFRRYTRVLLLLFWCVLIQYNCSVNSQNNWAVLSPFLYLTEKRMLSYRIQQHWYQVCSG